MKAKKVEIALFCLAAFLFAMPGIYAYFGEAYVIRDGGPAWIHESLPARIAQLVVEWYSLRYR